ncbi:germin-like protein subfamily 1 member 16 [Jatropha curcas]|uniref:germin-like protein subfamily 1 member 16 n=1 Tax=Jatropha curcas TaxID=180498 RepID=UPI001894FE8E|nr:germin-like protein subfamily 1 member 16 [Jatropha curcas]
MAYDPVLSRDICVATNDTNMVVKFNGKFCKDPEKVTADDFFITGLNVRKQTSKQLGVRLTLSTVDQVPGLNTNALSIVRIDFAPSGSLNPPHIHPRAAEILTVLEGTLYAGFITGNPDHRIFAKILKPGDVALAVLNSQNPGVVTIANTIFGATPSVNPDVLSRAFHLDKDLVTKLQKEEWVDPDQLY